MTIRIQQFPFGVGGGGGGLDNVVEDLTPQLGGFLDMNTREIRASVATGPAMIDVASALAAVFRPNRANATTGLGTNSTGSFAAMIHNGAEVFRFNSGGHLSLANINTTVGASLLNEVPTITNPTVVMNGAFLGSGLGGAGADPSMINAGAEKMRWGGTVTSFFQPLEASNAAGPEILDIASSGTVSTLRPNRGTVAGIGGTGGAVDIITGAGLSGLRVGTGPGQVNTVLQASGVSGLFIGSVSGSFGLHNVASSATVPTLLNNHLTESTGIGGVLNAVSMIAGSIERITANATGIGFFATAPVARPTGVAVTAAGIHAALVTLGLITA